MAGKMHGLSVSVCVQVFPRFQCVMIFIDHAFDRVPFGILLLVLVALQRIQSATRGEGPGGGLISNLSKSHTVVLAHLPEYL